MKKCHGSVVQPCPSIRINLVLFFYNKTERASSFLPRFMSKSVQKCSAVQRVSFCLEDEVGGDGKTEASEAEEVCKGNLSGGLQCNQTRSRYRKEK